MAFVLGAEAREHKTRKFVWFLVLNSLRPTVVAFILACLSDLRDVVLFLFALKKGFQYMLAKLLT